MILKKYIPNNAEKLNAWISFEKDWIFGTHFLMETEIPQCISTSFASICYPFMQFSIQMIYEIEEFGFNKRVLPSNGSPVRNYSNEIFPNRLIITLGFIGWPARSPDWNPSNFCMSYLKAKVSLSQPTIDDWRKDTDWMYNRIYLCQCISNFNWIWAIIC